MVWFYLSQKFPNLILPQFHRSTTIMECVFFFFMDINFGPKIVLIYSHILKCLIWTALRRLHIKKKARIRNFETMFESGNSFWLMFCTHGSCVSLLCIPFFCSIVLQAFYFADVWPLATSAKIWFRSLQRWPLECRQQLLRQTLRPCLDPNFFQKSLSHQKESYYFIVLNKICL